jgi:hypothetical protein
MKEEVINYLKSDPRFRERSKKWKGIANLLVKKYNLEIDAKKLMDIIAEASSMDRTWRDTLLNDKTLRGTDYYEDKDRLEQEKMLELGYEPNYNSNVAKLKTL